MLRFCPLSLKIMEKFVEVREATRQDCRDIRSLIQELADFEEMPDGPKIDHQVLEKEGFDRENPLFRCYVAICDGRIVGYALYFYIYATLNRKAIHLEDLYVTPEYREKHIGSRLFDTLAKQTFAEKCEYLDFSVLSWNPACSFYKARGALDLSELEGWRMYRLGGKALRHLATNQPSTCFEVRQPNPDDFAVIKLLAQETPAGQRINSVTNEVSIIIEDDQENERDKAYFGYLVAASGEQILGYALYCLAFSTWEGKSMYLQELQTSQTEHRTSVRDALLSAVAKKAWDEECARMDLWTLGKGSAKWYASNGAVDLTDAEEWRLYRLFEFSKRPQPL